MSTWDIISGGASGLTVQTEDGHAAASVDGVVDLDHVVLLVSQAVLRAPDGGELQLRVLVEHVSCC